MHILPVKRRNQNAENPVSAVQNGTACSDRGQHMETAGLRLDCGRPSAAVPVHSWLGMGGFGGYGADLRRLGADWYLREVRACA